MNVELHQTASDLEARSTDVGRESACRLAAIVCTHHCHQAMPYTLCTGKSQSFRSNLWVLTTCRTAMCEMPVMNNYESLYRQSQQYILRYRREHSASDSGTNRKPVCDFLLVINTNLHPLLHRFQVMTGQILANDTGVPHFNVLNGVIPCKYRRK